MACFLVENRAVRTIIKARDSEAAARRFRARYPAYEHMGTYTVRLSGPCIPGVEPRRSPI